MNPQSSNITRRDFIGKSVASVGAGLVLGAPGMLRAASAGESDKIHVGLIGTGRMGRALLDAMSNISGLHFQAVCDIWDYNRQSGVIRVRSLQGTAPPAYVDIDDMLAKEKGLDAVVIAVPDFWHSPYTVKCLEAGLHVYCEEPMSNTIDGARAMVKAMEKSGKLCQIGYQRRSNPRYRFTHDQLINGHKICGQIVNVNGQWNRPVTFCQDIAFRPKLALDPAVLTKYSYKDMHQFTNWRHYRDLCGGPICDLGGQQIDVFNWFLGATPKSVFASGGNVYFKNREHFDNLMAIFDYDTPQGEVRAFYQILTAASEHNGYFEGFMGTEGTIRISENSYCSNAIIRDDSAPSWGPLVVSGLLKANPIPGKTRSVSPEGILTGPTDLPDPDYGLTTDLPQIQYRNGSKGEMPPHQPHLDNFFAAVRGEAKLNCDARAAFLSEAPVYWVNRSALSKQPIVFTPEQLSV